MATLDVLSQDEADRALKIGASDNSNDPRIISAVTAISLRLDELCGPIVVRTITAEEHHDLDRTTHLWVRERPVSSFTTVTEYDRSGSSTTLSAETVSSKPAAAYRADRSEGTGTLTGKIHRRSSGQGAYFGESVAVTYVAGRYTTTALVAPLFKEAASVALINWWQQVLAQPGGPSTPDLDYPTYRFPRQAIPQAALDILGDEARYTVGVA